jgi:hypothetical protein
MVTPSNIQINCTTVTNWSFQLQGCKTLDVASFWTNIGSALSGTGGTNLFSDNNPATDTARFYRVQAR